MKGKGYAPAEKDPSTWHAPGIFDAATGERQKSDPSKPPKWQDVFGNTLVEIAEQNPQVVGITAAMPSGTSMNLMQSRFPDRTFDVGISEGHAVTFAGGMAKDNLKPFVAIYSSFLQRAYDHIIHDVAIEGLPVVLCLDRAGLVGEDGATHHGVFDLSYLRSIPGITVASPRNADMLRRLMYTALSFDGPFAIRYPRGNAPEKPSCTDESLPVGKGEKLRDGNNAVILTIGPVAADALKAAERAEKELGVSVAVYDMVFLKPADTDILSETADKGCPIITIEDGTVNGGLGSTVLEWMAENSHSVPVTRLGVPDRFIPQGKPDELHRLCGFDTDSIFNTIAKVTSKK